MIPTNENKLKKPVAATRVCPEDSVLGFSADAMVKSGVVEFIYSLAAESIRKDVHV